MDFIKDFRKLISENSIQNNIRLDDSLNDFYYICNYIDIKNRWFVNIKPYGIVTSNIIQKKFKYLNKQEITSIEDIKHRIQNGIPIVSYLSGWIDKNEIEKSDWLLKNFSIYHCHLEERMPNGHFERKSNHLLFFCKCNDVVYFIDIKKHPNGYEWLDIDLLKVIEENGWLQLLSYSPNTTAPLYDLKTLFQLSKMSTIFVNLNYGIAMSRLDLTQNSWDAVNLSHYWVGYLLRCQKWCENAEELLNIFPNTQFDFELIIEDHFFVAHDPHVLDGIKIKLCEIPEFMYCFEDDT